MTCTIIAVHNTVGEVKPLWLVHDGNKSKIDYINSIIKVKDVTLFNVTCGGQIMVLSFDGYIWSIG